MKRIVQFARDLDIDTAVLTYFLSGPLVRSNFRIRTVGLSVTLLPQTAGEAAFAGLAAGDEVLIYDPKETLAEQRRVLTAVAADGSSAVVGVAIDLNAGSNFSFRKNSSGTGAEDGWVLVNPALQYMVEVEYNAGDLTGGLDFRIEGRLGTPGALPVQLFPVTPGAFHTFAAPGFNARLIVDITTRVSQIRLGMKANTADPGDPVTEQVSAFLYEGRVGTS